MKNRVTLLFLTLLAVVACGASGCDHSETPKATYSVVLTDGGGSKIAVIKAIREVTGLGLRDAKDMVDSSPCVIQSGLSHDAAKAVVERLAGAGAEVIVKRR